PKGERGRHTTRQAELLPLAQGWVVDTPGFSRLDLDEVDERMLPYLFPDLVAAGRCRLPDCRHRVEPGCAVREAVARGDVDAERYRSYLALLEEIRHRTDAR
ncbi:MAG: GTPase RsgA, partial [Clostridia bacterium]|nr:GTPase RsgA [Clostridia bacterium]